MVFEAVLQLTNASFDIFSRRLTGLADLPHMAASVCTLQTPQLFSNW
jgi:hypothetical protein